jgi:hypothetical protein
LITTIITASNRLIFINDKYIKDNKIIIEDDILGHFLGLTDKDVSEILAATGAEEFILKETCHVQPVATDSAEDSEEDHAGSV